MNYQDKLFKIMLALYPLVSTQNLTQEKCKMLKLPSMPEGSNAVEWEDWRNKTTAILAKRKAKLFLEVFEEGALEKLNE